MLLIKGAEVYAPEYLGKKDVLIAGEKIERIGEDLPEYEGCQVIDGTGPVSYTHLTLPTNSLV